MIVSTRIHLYPLTLKDAPALYALVDKSRDHLTNLVWAKDATLESVTEFIHKKQFGKEKIFGIYHNGIIAGVIETRNKGWHAELGYWLGHEFRGYGIMTKVVKYMTDSLAGKIAISATIKVGNESSLAILKHAGLMPVSEADGWISMLRPRDGI